MQNLFQKYQGYTPDEATQKMINQPVKDETGFNEGHEDFLKILIAKLENGEIKTYLPETLYNRVVYDKLSEEEQEKADLTAVNLMSLIRQIEQLWKLDQSSTFQIQNLVESVFQMKSRFEKQHGNVYVI